MAKKYSFEEYKLIYDSAEKVTDRRISNNKTNYSMSIAILAAIAIIWKWAIDNNIHIFPGCITPTEIEMALEAGLTTLKFFPAEQAGGLAMIKALCAPYTNVEFIPTGGIDLANLVEYLAFPKVIACGGSFMVKDELISSDEWEKITELTRSAVEVVKQVRSSA